MRPIDRLPQVGERILVRDTDTGGFYPATVIGMNDCAREEPELFGGYRSEPYLGRIPPAVPYTAEETIRAWRYDEPVKGRMAMFCIMGFSRPPFFNENIFFPD